MSATLPIVTVEQFETTQFPPIEWLWEGVLAPGMVTLLTSRWKVGKTTLLSVLLARCRAGGELAGGAVKPCDVIVVSEEPPALWQQRHARLKFGNNVRFLCRPFKGRPTTEQWEEFILKLAEEKPDLVVFDPTAMFLPCPTENDSVAMIDALVPLHVLTDGGAAVLLIHHTRKGLKEGDVVPRGNGSLPAFADVLSDLYAPRNAESDRIRRLVSLSRLDGLNPRLVELASRTIELTPDGCDYVRVPEQPDLDSFEAGWPVLRMVLEDAERRPTRVQILKGWPADFAKPSMSTLIRWLTRAEKEGKIECKGTGRCKDAFRYNLMNQVFDFEMDLPELPKRSYFVKPKPK